MARPQITFSTKTLLCDVGTIAIIQEDAKEFTIELFGIEDMQHTMTAEEFRAFQRAVLSFEL